MNFPDGIKIDNFGNVNWDNAQSGKFGFVLNLIDQNDWVYSNEIVFEVESVDEGLKLTQFNTTSFIGGKSLEDDSDGNFVTYVGYVFNENITEWTLGGDANEPDLVFNLYMASNISTNDDDFVLIDSRKLSELELKEKRLAFAQYHLYENLSSLKGDVDPDDLDFVSSYAIIENGDQTLRSKFNFDTLTNRCVEVQDQDLQASKDFEDASNVQFRLNGVHSDPFNNVTHSIVEDTNSELTFPQGIQINPSSGWVNWDNAFEGSFGFTLRLVDGNNYYYDTPIEFTVGAISSVKAGDIGVKYYPNPVVNSMTIEFNESKSREIKIFNSNGTNVKSMNINGGTININLTDLTEGAYYLEADGILFPIIKN